MAAAAQYSYVGRALSDRSRSIEAVCRGEDGSVFTGLCRVVQSVGEANLLDRPGRQMAVTRGASLHCEPPLTTGASKSKKASDWSFSCSCLAIESRIWPQRKPEGLLLKVGSLYGENQGASLTTKLKANKSCKEHCFHGADVLPSSLIWRSLKALPALERCTCDLSSAPSLSRLGSLSLSESWSSSQALHSMGHSILFPRGSKMPISSRIGESAKPRQGLVNADVGGGASIIPGFDIQDGEDTSVSDELASESLISDDVEEQRKTLDKMRLAVFVSGGGSNLRALHASILGDKINGEVAVVVSDKPKCGGCEYAREHGIPVIAFPRSKAAPEGVSADQLVTMVLNLGVKYVLLAGYLKLIPAELVRAFPRAVINIHPALLPAFGGKGYFGMHVHEAVVRSGVRVSGATVHFVEEEYDMGPIIAQQVVPVYPLDSAHDVAQRVLNVEHELYSWVAAALCDGRIVWREDGRPMVCKSWDDPNCYL